MKSISIFLPGEIERRLLYLTHRRYGDDQEARTRMVEEIMRWNLDRWDRDGITTTEWFCVQMTTLPIKWVSGFAWGKLIAPYMKD